MLCLHFLTCLLLHGTTAPVVKTRNCASSSRKCKHFIAEQLKLKKFNLNKHHKNSLTIPLCSSASFIMVLEMKSKDRQIWPPHYAFTSCTETWQCIKLWKWILWILLVGCHAVFYASVLLHWCAVPLISLLFLSAVITAWFGFLPLLVHEPQLHNCIEFLSIHSSSLLLQKNRLPQIC